MSGSQEKDKELEAKIFSPPNEAGPQEGKLVKPKMDADEGDCTLLVRDFPEDESLQQLQSHLADFAALRRTPTRAANGDVHAVYYTAKDVQSVLDWYSGLRAPRFFGHPVQLFALKNAPPKQVWDAL